MRKKNTMIFNLGERNSVANTFLAGLRDVNTQRDRLRFRTNVERLGEIMAYEISRHFSFQAKTVVTPLGQSIVTVLEQPPVLLTILRAGLPYFQGFLNYFEDADCGFIGAYREESKNDVTIKLDYLAIPEVENKPVILIDPMLATGKSLADSVKLILQRGTPSRLFVASLISAPEGIAFLKHQISLNYTLWTWAIDERLNQQYYIVPGLGDAGDLSYGNK